jgi:hypothetical protein
LIQTNTMKKRIFVAFVLIGPYLSALSTNPTTLKTAQYPYKPSQLDWAKQLKKVDSNSRFRKGNSYFSLGAVSSTLLNNDAFYSPLGEPKFPLAVQLKVEYALSDRIGIALNSFYQFRQGFLQYPYPSNVFGLQIPANSSYKFQQHIYGFYPFVFIHAKRNRLIHHYFGLGIGNEVKNKIAFKNDLERAKEQYSFGKINLLFGINALVYKNVKIYSEASVQSLNFGLLYQFSNSKKTINNP